jgi:hypothetical protein
MCIQISTKMSRISNTALGNNVYHKKILLREIVRMRKLPLDGGCEGEGEAGGGAESVMVGECCEMVGRVGVWQLDSLDILRSGLWVAVRTEEEDARLSSRVNYKGEQVHTHTLTVEEGAAGSGFFS